MSVNEVVDIITAESEKAAEKYKIRCIENYNLAMMITGIFKTGKGDTIPPIWEFFPDTFAEEKAAAEVREDDTRMQIYKADMLAYTERFNRRFKKKTEDIEGENGDGGECDRETAGRT